MPAGHQETEIKLPLDSAAQGRRLLSRAGFRVRRRRVHEENWVLDTPDFSLRSHGRLLRVRRAGPLATLTFKGQIAADKHKSRPESETAVADPEAALEILRGLGFQVVFRYEKYRTEYAKNALGGFISLDETPIGVFMEIEGEGDWIDQTAAVLNFSESVYITASYTALYEAFRLRHGGRSDAMLFLPREY